MLAALQKTIVFSCTRLDQGLSASSASAAEHAAAGFLDLAFQGAFHFVSVVHAGFFQLQLAGQCPSHSTPKWRKTSAAFLLRIGIGESQGTLEIFIFLPGSKSSCSSVSVRLS